MIHFFRVMLTGYDMTMRDERGTEIGVGFVTNVYVFARSERLASVAATKLVVKRLRTRAAQNAANLERLRIEVDETVRSVEVWKFFRREGLVFFPV